MTEKIKCTLTCELVEVYKSREAALLDWHNWDYEGEQYIVARNKYPVYDGQWAVYQVITIGNEEVI